MIFLGVSIALLTQALNGLIYSYSPGAQVAGAGAVIVIVMQVNLYMYLFKQKSIYFYFANSFSGSFYLAVQKIQLYINLFIQDSLHLYHLIIMVLLLVQVILLAQEKVKLRFLHQKLVVNIVTITNNLLQVFIRQFKILSLPLHLLMY